ncbi:MAG: aminomethyltransferase [Candidatus Rokuibacteriota bacterium]|nr:MAG: aminomethyltransferase [Candidatus Rokubacteria bacterium]
MRAKRLPVHPAQRIDRARLVTFTFAGRPFTGFPGDSVGSALHAAGVRVFSRSFKYHRPRGLLCCRGHCPNCLVNIDGVPNVRACVEPLREGQRVEPQHAWPSLEWDALAILDRLHFLFPVGFYYKTFIHPRRLWPAYERVLRWFAGLGRISFPEEPPGEYERAHLFADVAVVGGGAAGMAGALEAARWGASVLLVDDQPELGGRWRLHTRAETGRAGWEVARDLGAQITATEGIRVLTGATAFGLYEDNLLGVLEGNRLVRLRARQVVVATGGLEYPMVFENNDLPGVMLGGGARRLLTLYGVRPGRRAVVVAGDDRGAELALELQAAGVGVQALADARAEPEAAAAGGIPVLAGHTVLAARGSGRVTHAVLGDLRSGGRREIECDLLCLATGFEPAAGLIGQAGGRLRATGNGSVTLGELPPGVLAAGEVTGLHDLSAIIASGRAAGARAALALWGPSAPLTARVEELDGQAATGPAAARRYVSVAPGQAAKRFVCLCEDVTEKDLAQAVAEGFDHIETLKRYSTVTMGPCQGKMCHRLSVDLCASLTGRTLDETGATTARPPAQPVPLGALAARQADPVKLTPMHHQHVEAGARLMDMGPWKRPLVYGSVDEECRAVHEAVGLIDVSTLGKLEVAGGDGGAFLDWLHPNRFSDMEPGRVRYRVMCDDAGIVLDDGVVARLDDRFLVTTGTGTIEAIEQWFEWWLAGSGRCAHVVNLTGALAAINVAGPRSRELLAGLADVDLSPAACPYLAARRARIAGVPSTLLRIGFVGELGFEIHCPADYGEFMWQTLMEAGAPLGVRAFGVEAQRVLRLEKQHPIIAQDTDALTDPFAANLGGLVRLDKPDFIGRDALIAARGLPAREQLVGFELEGTTTPPGEGATIVDGGRPVGRVTSAKWSAWLGRVIGLAYVPAGLARAGQSLQVRVDGGSATARVVLRPFHDPDGARVRS